MYSFQKRPFFTLVLKDKAKRIKVPSPCYIGRPENWINPSKHVETNSGHKGSEDVRNCFQQFISGNSRQFTKKVWFVWTYSELERLSNLKSKRSFYKGLKCLPLAINRSLPISFCISTLSGIVHGSSIFSKILLHFPLGFPFPWSSSTWREGISNLPPAHPAETRSEL